MSFKISRKRVFQQLKADLIGKDSYRGVTLTYAWLANQFGHIALGFIPTFLVNLFFCVSILKSAIYVTLFWFLFELYNFLGPLLGKRKQNSDKEKYIFKPKWLNVAFDTFTDVCFFALGAILCIISIDKFEEIGVLITVIALSIYLAFATKYWYVTKMYQFYARFPFQFRLSQWNFNISESDKKSVVAFLETKSKGNHLLVFGSLSTGKTSLGVGILNELSIQNNACLYLNSIKLYDYFFKNENDVLKAHEIWDWKNSDFLMIDDINPSEFGVNKLVTPNDFLKFLEISDQTKKTKNKTILKEKNIIWVLGKLDQKISDNDWVKMLKKDIGVIENKISVINLQKAKG
jgi:hypothetical protein